MTENPAQGLHLKRAFAPQLSVRRATLWQLRVGRAVVLCSQRRPVATFALDVSTGVRARELTSRSAQAGGAMPRLRVQTR